jgi:hypothetical protein
VGREETYEDREGKTHLDKALNGYQAMVNLQGESISATACEGLHEFIGIASPRGCEGIIILLKKAIMDLDKPAEAIAGLRVLDSCVKYTAETRKGDDFVTVFKVRSFMQHL